MCSFHSYAKKLGLAYTISIVGTLAYKLTANLRVLYFFIVDIITVKLRNAEEIR